MEKKGGQNIRLDKGAFNVHDSEFNSRARTPKASLNALLKWFLEAWMQQAYSKWSGDSELAWTECRGGNQKPQRRPVLPGKALWILPSIMQCRLHWCKDCGIFEKLRFLRKPGGMPSPLRKNLAMLSWITTMCSLICPLSDQKLFTRRQVHCTTWTTRSKCCLTQGLNGHWFQAFKMEARR